MPETTKRYHYKSVTLPEPLLNRIERFLKNNPEYGYTSIAEFIKEAIREKLSIGEQSAVKNDK